MADPFLLQKQIKDNSEDLHNFVRDLKLWEEDMKRKDRLLSNEQSEEVLPPIRRRKLPEKTQDEEKKENESKNKRIASHDYKAWEKFDVEKACEAVDEGGNESNSHESDVELQKEEETYLKEKALYEKELGNKHVKASNWDKAIESYTRAISAYARDPVFFANRALCYLKKKQYKLVEVDCTEALKLDSTYVKALMRRAAAREALGRLEDARHDLTEVMRLEPNNIQAQRDLARVRTAANSMDKKLNKSNESHKDEPLSKQSENKSLKSTMPTTSQNNFTKVETTDSNTASKPITENTNDEPNWSTSEAIVQPIIKPPHLRSKKSLKRIEIFDTGLNAPKHVCSRKSSNEQNPEIKQPVVSSSVVEEIPSQPKQKSIYTDATPASSVKTVPPPPKTSVQFHLSWESIKTDKDMCFQFLKKIEGGNLPDIFKESLESRMFSNIIAVLASEFVAANEPVLPYLRGLSNVRRFSTIVLFTSPADKKNLLALFEYCLRTQESSQEEIIQLQRLYEL